MLADALWVARLLSRDPLGEAGGVNLYAYVRNTPLRYFDPFGLTEYIGFPSDRLPPMKVAVANAIQCLASGCAGPSSTDIERAIEKAVITFDSSLPSCGQTPLYGPPGGPYAATGFKVGYETYCKSCGSLESTVVHEGVHITGVVPEGMPRSAEEDCSPCFAK